ncbi:MAG: hypothetical protein ACI9RO_001296, partial [Alteromonas macleodii]
KKCVQYSKKIDILVKLYFLKKFNKKVLNAILKY